MDTTYRFDVVVRTLPQDPTELFDLDGVIGATERGRVARVSFRLTADSAEAAAFHACAQLRGTVAKPLRYDEDLVTVSETADRADVSRETVRLWSTGERRQGFPTAHAHIVDSQVWKWADVATWLKSQGVEAEGLEEEMPLPSELVTIHNGVLAERREVPARDWAYSASYTKTTLKESSAHTMSSVLQSRVERAWNVRAQVTDKVS